MNYQGVVSPEKTRIAFMSARNNGTDATTGEIGIYITSVEGGEPTKVETSIPIADSGLLANSLTEENVTILIDWK